MAPFRWWIILAVFLSFATVGASVGLMAVSAYLISKAALATEVSQLTLAVTGVRVFALSRASLRYFERYITHTATFRILTHLRVWFYKAIAPLAPARLQGYRSGDLLARIVADLETLENFYVRVIVPPLSAALVVALGGFLLGSFDWRLGLALVCFLLVTGVVLPLAVQWVSRRPAAESVNARAELNTVLVDEILGMADLLSSGQESIYQERVLLLSDSLNHQQERLATVRGIAHGLVAFLTGLAGVTVLWLAIPLVSGGEMDGLYLALLPLAAIACFEAVTPLSQSLQYLESSKEAGRRLFELIDASPAVIDPAEPASAPSSYAIEVNDLCFAYAPDEPSVLHDLTFSVPAGTSAALVGSSGAGKTTLVNLLLRFWDYSEGSITIGGQELRDVAAEEARRLIGIVPQHPYLFNTTIRDNLLLANPDAGDEDLIQACQIAQLHDFIASLPKGYETRIGDDGLGLSGGERQRLAIARAVLKDAPILVLDEATSHLDAVTKAGVMDNLAVFMEGRTTLVISHEMDTGRFEQAIKI
jgi:ATP-binding cassette subfamily C protein CydC